MAAGDLLLDPDGDRILEDDGDEQLSDGAGDDCCCGAEPACGCTSSGLLDNRCLASTPSGSSWDEWTVTLSGITHCDCVPDVGFGTSHENNMNDLNGTYADIPAFANGIWDKEFVIAGGTFVAHGNETCTSAVTTYTANRLHIRLSFGESIAGIMGVILDVWVRDVAGVGPVPYIYSKTFFVASDCLVETIDAGANSLLLADCGDSATNNPPYHLSHSGTALITCC